MSEVWGSLTRLMASDFPVLYADFLRGCDPVLFERAGVFVPYEPRELADCPECDELCPIEVLPDDDGNDELFCVCMDHGWSRVDPLAQRRWWLHWEPVLKQFVSAMEIKGTWTPIVPDFVWKLGRQSRREFLFVRCCWAEHIKMLTAELVKHPKAVFVTLTPGAVTRLSITLPNRAFSLEETAVLDDEVRLNIDLEKIEAILGPEEKPKIKPPTRRGHRSVHIEKLIHELRQHLLAARDHFWETGNLLPKPTMLELGKMIGIEKYAVSRCIRDPDADKLRFLWKHADDINFVSNWKG